MQFYVVCHCIDMYNCIMDHCILTNKDIRYDTVDFNVLNIKPVFRKRQT